MESMFKYIFALIVGAVFIIFFVGFAMNYKTQAEGVAATEMVIGFDDYLLLLSGASDLKGTYPFLSSTTVTFDEGKIQSGKASTDTNRIVFAPKTLKGDSMTIWTKRWSFPYPVDNFFYMTNNKNKQFIIYDDSSSEFVNEFVGEMNDTFKIDAIKYTNNLQNKFNSNKNPYLDYANVRFVIISESPASIATAVKGIGITNKDIVIVKKGEEASWEDYGTVKFEDGESYYLGTEMIAGAMFAEDKANYDFALERALKRMAGMTEIYRKKAEYLSGGAFSSCEYTTLMNGLSTIQSKASAEPTDESIAIIATQANSIKEFHKENFGGDCPAVF